MTCRHNQITVSSLRINNPPCPRPEYLYKRRQHRSTARRSHKPTTPTTNPSCNNGAGDPPDGRALRPLRAQDPQGAQGCARCVSIDGIRIRSAAHRRARAVVDVSFHLTHARMHADADLYIMRAGVEDVWASVDTGLVVVAGYALDASMLRWRVQSRSRRPVVVVSDGAAEDAPPPLDSAQMVHLGPPGGYPQYYGWAPAHHQLPLHGRYDAPPPYYGGHDDNPNGCCTMQ